MTSSVDVAFLAALVPLGQPHKERQMREIFTTVEELMLAICYQIHIEATRLEEFQIIEKFLLIFIIE